GQYALALWDARRQRLMLGRDRLGVRPLFYTMAGGSLLFASEIKALLADPRVPRRPDLRALDQIFTYWAALPGRSVCEGSHEEPRFQQRMARYLGTEHHVVECRQRDIGAVFPDVIWHTETPVLRTAPAPLFLLSALVRRHGLKVVLTGEGADEFLAGYNIFKE